MSTLTEDDRKSFRSASVEDIMKAAHRERAEAIKQLFGFGFGVVKEKAKTLSGTDDYTAIAAQGAARGL